MSRETFSPIGPLPNRIKYSFAPGSKLWPADPLGLP